MPEIQKSELKEALLTIRRECLKHDTCYTCPLFQRNTNYCGVINDYPRFWTMCKRENRIF